MWRFSYQYSVCFKNNFSCLFPRQLKIKKKKNGLYSAISERNFHNIYLQRKLCQTSLVTLGFSWVDRHDGARNRRSIKLLVADSCVRVDGGFKLIPKLTVILRKE